MKRYIIAISSLILLASLAHADTIFAFNIPSFGAPSAAVGALPSCNASRNGLIYTVIDALAPNIAAIVVGGGAITLIVHCNGTNWVVA